MSLIEKIILAILLLLMLFGGVVRIAHAGTTFQPLSKTIQYIQMDKIAEQRREAKEMSEKGMSKDRLREIKENADEVLTRYASSPLVLSIVTEDRVGLMKLMKKSPIFVMAMASQMRHEFMGKKLTQYEDNVRIVLRYAETQARDSKDLNRVLGILEDISKNRASSSVGATVFSNSTIMTLWHP